MLCCPGSSPSAPGSTHCLALPWEAPATNLHQEVPGSPSPLRVFQAFQATCFVVVDQSTMSGQRFGLVNSSVALSCLYRSTVPAASWLDEARVFNLELGGFRFSSSSSPSASIVSGHHQIFCPSGLLFSMMTGCVPA